MEPSYVGPNHDVRLTLELLKDLGWVTQTPGEMLTCHIEMSQTAYSDGDMVTATSFRLVNPDMETVLAEIKSWLASPGQEPRSFLRTDSVLPPEFDQDFGPVECFAVASDTPRGTYRFNCRLPQPVTGETPCLDENVFEVQSGSRAVAMLMPAWLSLALSTS